jgi:hypothetical protein
VGTVVSLLEYRYTKLYREQVELWHSRGLGLSTSRQIAAHVCRSEFAGRIKLAEMRAVNARLNRELPAALARLEEAS